MGKGYQAQEPPWDVIRSDAAILNTEISTREVDMTSRDVC